jgi:hypothetical protein
MCVFPSPLTKHVSDASATTGSRKTVRYRVTLQAKRLSDFGASEDLHPLFMTQTRSLMFPDKFYDIDLDSHTSTNRPLGTLEHVPIHQVVPNIMCVEMFAS